MNPIPHPRLTRESLFPFALLAEPGFRCYENRR